MAQIADASYRGDTLDNLAGVCQGGIFSGTSCPSGSSRTFDYSSLGPLVSATNLEKDSATTYTYDRNGNLLTRVDGGVATTMAYDARDRITSKSYSGSTPAVYYCYDGAQTTGNCTGAPTETGYLYGRLTMVRSNGTDSTSYPFNYEYNLANGVTLLHYPSGRDVATTYNGAGRPEGVTGYASVSQYWPHGGMKTLALANGVTETTQYDSRLRMSSLEAKTADQTKLLGLNYTYYNNSNVQTQQITGSGLVANQSYGYDGVNRLASAEETGGVWSRGFGYDLRGNGWLESWTGIPPDNFTPRSAGWFNSQNRLVNAGLNINYSPAGNQTAIGAYTFQYDGENRLKESTINAASVTYAYDGEGRRVKRTAGSQTTVYVYNAMGELAAEYGGETTGSGLQYLTADALDSTRLVTNASGGVVSRLDYLPFGEEIPAGVGGRSALWSAPLGATQEFTGKERDAETGLDYFGARYYSGAQGRFTSPDPLGANVLRVINPQRWNMYAYALNSPLVYVDPDGRDGILVNFSKLAGGLGHRAVVSVHRDGKATFAEFGPRGGGKPVWFGHHNTYALNTKVEFGPNRLPTDQSYREIIREIASKEDPPQPVDSISLAYYKTSDADTLLLDQYISWTSNGWSSPYVVGVYDCVTYSYGALHAAHVDYGSLANLNLAPNYTFDLLMNAADVRGEKAKRVDPEADRKPPHKRKLIPRGDQGEEDQ